MCIPFSRFITSVFVCLIIFQQVKAESNQLQEHVFVSLRLMGHEILLASGDSASRVLPIEKDGDRYTLKFESPFSFDPQLITSIIDSITNKTNIASQYLVEIRDCDSGNVVYSYEVGGAEIENLIPCRGRFQPKGCYIIYYRIDMAAIPFENWKAQNKASESLIQPTPPSRSISEVAFYLLIGLVIIVLIVFKLRRISAKKSLHIITIGNYLFDHKNMTLKKGNEKFILTGKEADLLKLLYSHLNSTVDRDVILKEVWQDSGDYIGRTLDVYISKLRKKLESDPAISILNVRGVGYKLILD